MDVSNETLTSLLIDVVFYFLIPFYSEAIGYIEGIDFDVDL